MPVANPQTHRLRHARRSRLEPPVARLALGCLTTKMQSGTLKWTLGCITSAAWGLLTIPGTLHPVPRARPYGARAVPPYSSGLICRLGGSPPVLPTPLRAGTRMHSTRLSPPTHNASAAVGVPSMRESQNAPLSTAPKALAWEEAARPQGLFPSYPRRCTGEGQVASAKRLRQCWGGRGVVRVIKFKLK